MRGRTLIILGVILVALIAVKVAMNLSHRAELERSGLESVLPGDLAASEIGRLVVKGPAGGDVVLERRGLDWVVASSWGQPADGTKLQRLTESIAALTGEFRSDDPAVLADYGLDSTRAVRLKVYDTSGAERAALLLGDTQAGAGGFFVKSAEGERTYATRSNLIGELGIWGDNRDPEGKRFLDLKIFTAAREDVDGITLRRGDEAIRLDKVFHEPEADSLPVDRTRFTWQVDGGEAEQSPCNAVLSALGGIWARDVLDPAGDWAFADSAMVAEVRFADGATRRLEFGLRLEEPEAGRALRLSGREGVFLISPGLADRVFKARADFAPKVPGR
ncbi:MAG: DUF4340 domain-containing protein [Candidatus Krumholzibacteriota bacterium]|nr:DUF4340 domain-containing protein [Candidatus Krumholzibacteriota bacterium]